MSTTFWVACATVWSGLLVKLAVMLWRSER